MRELGVRIDTPISALLTLNPRRVFVAFRFVFTGSVGASLNARLSKHTHTHTHTHAHLAGHSLQSAPQSQ